MSFQHPVQISTGHPLNPYTAPPSFSRCYGTSLLMRRRPEQYEPFLVYNSARRCRRQLITFDIFPDDVLLDIFDFYVHEDVHENQNQSIEKWTRLAHVCRRWRSIVFQSPHRLNLRLVCTSQTPTRDILDIWPPLPLIIRDFDSLYSARPFIEDNIIAALEHNDLVCKIQLIFPELGCFTNSAAILRPFPELKFLQLSNINVGRHTSEQPERILPDSFLGGSAPRLESLYLDEVSFPELPKLLLPSTHLVNLDLSFIPRSGYIPPEEMANGLSTLTSLESLRLHFRYPPPRAASALETRPPPPPPSRSILRSLTKIRFKGTSEYLEVILAWIDAPRLDKLDIAFFNQITFDTPQLYQFVSRRPMLRALEMGRIAVESKAIIIKFSSRTSYDDVFNVGIRCTTSEWQLSSLEAVCTSSLPPFSTLEDLYISEDQYWRPHWQDDVETALWLDLLRSFDAVKNLYISKEFIPRIAPALQELVRERTTEVFPVLENIVLEGFRPSRPLQEGIKRFVVARQLISRPVAVSLWDRGRTHGW